MWYGIVKYHERWADHINGVSNSVFITKGFPTKGEASKYAKTVAKVMCIGKKKPQKGQPVKTGEAVATYSTSKVVDLGELSGAPYYPTIIYESLENA